jgi:hypothetical protein
MTGSAMLARWYHVDLDAEGDVVLALVEDELADVAITDGVLEGAHVRVSTNAVLVAEESDGGLVGRAVDALTAPDGTLCFDPSKGGMRTRENRRARGAFNNLVAEANRFGMVNSYAHADAAARYVNRLLCDVGAPALPSVGVVVGAHSGSWLAGYAQGDGDLRTGALRPMSGGHYRLSTRTTVVPEFGPVAPTGEIHLGPSRYRKPFAGWPSYLRNAAHNPAIVFHEFGHHVCRHTADFRCNADRAAERQRNGKPGVEEGICDYLTASLLRSGRPYGWYRADRGSRRDVEEIRRAVDPEENADAHAIGAAWASAFWSCRSRLLDAELLDDPEDHDRILVHALVEVGATGVRADGRGRRRREAKKCEPATMIGPYLDALGDVAGRRAAGVAEEIFEQVGLLDAPRVAMDASSPC